MTDLLRTEQYMIAVGHGMQNEADRDIIIAGGWSSRYNQLGYLIVNFENTIDRKRRTHDKRKRADLMGYLIALLATTGTYIEDARELADLSVSWRTDRWCRFCNGTGVISVEQTQCPVCLGEKELRKPANCERILAEMSAAVEYWEGQLNARMKNWTPAKPGAKRTFHILGSEHGTYTPPAPPCE